MKNNKKIMISILSVLVCIMAVGYALFAQELTINGNASIDSTWKVEITNITSKDVVGDAVNKVDPTYTATTANFSVGLTRPGDSITYDITVTNKGTLDAVVESITINKDNNSAIKNTTIGLKRGNKIAKNNGTNTLTIKVEYDSNVTNQPVSGTNDITVTINYQQDLGQVPAYETYSIGDTINFAGSNWRVIKNSTAEEDYVTLLKLQPLTAEEIGDQYSYKLSGVGQPYMAYYWSATCHYKGTYGTDTYNDIVETECDGNNDYNGSKIKSAVEEYMNNYLDYSKLKTIDNYKIRLIKFDELITNFGYIPHGSGYAAPYGNLYWLYGDDRGHFWTMSPDVNSTVRTWGSGWNGIVFSYQIIGADDISYGGVRPVINLLKSAID